MHFPESIQPRYSFGAVAFDFAFRNPRPSSFSFLHFFVAGLHERFQRTEVFRKNLRRASANKPDAQTEDKGLRRRFGHLFNPPKQVFRGFPAMRSSASSLSLVS